MIRPRLSRQQFLALLGAALANPLSASAATAQDGLDRHALKALSDRAVETASDAVVIYRNGKKVFDYHSAKPVRPIYIMSCTKSIVGLAVGQAIAEGKIKSIDQPVHDFFPEWNQDRKKLVTIRHLLTMTSGLREAAGGDDIYPFPDSLKMVLAAELAAAPGAGFSYANKAVNLLGGIIHVATGDWLDAYVEERFFDPMDIQFWRWARDEAGNAYAFADLSLLADDFAKFGTLLLQKGMWNGKQLAPASWIEQLAGQSQPYEALYGLLWWRLPTGATGALTAEHLAVLAKGGVEPLLIEQLKPLVGKPVRSMAEWHRLLAAAVPKWEDRAFAPGLIGPYADDIPTWRYDGFDGVAAEGYLGQYLVVFPKLGLVGVRQIEPFEGFDFMKNRFEEFPDMVRSLAGAVGRTG